MTNSTGPDPLSAAERRAVLREHLEREKDRRRIAEARVAGLEDALRRHTLSFADPKGGGELCGGCLKPSPCPDAGLCGEKPSP